MQIKVTKKSNRYAWCETRVRIMPEAYASIADSHLLNVAQQQRSTQITNKTSFQHDMLQKTNKKWYFQQNTSKEKTKFRGSEEKINYHAHQCTGDPGWKPCQFKKKILEARDFANRKIYSPQLLENIITKFEDTVREEPN